MAPLGNRGRHKAVDVDAWAMRRGVDYKTG
ncbi:hypothetical protein MPNT_190008 [Candidatus Methylacidithermus pantelleriae]|uniref:Uncharacterized protein n=1 Tax=Candidatus Methylacidithermus pantelleriae TaxID=2744239 RepID=A0A8J2FRZ5_9BACT|nr:hypothetical protein MPNT_190008 [Candidatus Methylacidithermus pantelleriae]